MDNQNMNNNEEMHLDDAARVRVLSPGMMVFKRFVRNKLAIIGIAIIVFMFAFSFLGGLLNPYSQSQVFYTTEEILKDYAGATLIDQFQFYTKDGETLPKDINSKAMLASVKKQYVFESKDGNVYGLGILDDNNYIIYSLTEVKMLLRKNAEYDAAVAAGRNFFENASKTYLVEGQDAKATVYEANEIGLGCKSSFTPYDQNTKFSYDFYREALIAETAGEKSFEAD